MADINIDSLEPNSHKYKAEKAQRENDEKIQKKKKVTPIISHDQIVSTKKPLSKKFVETFVTEDTKDVKSWLLMDVLIPGIKNTILDILSMMFFGELNSRSRRSKRNGFDRENYSSYYYKDSSNGNSHRRRNDRYDSDDKIDFRNIVLRQRGDAEQILDEMKTMIRKNGSVSVAELLDLLDLPSQYTDNNWGWDDERDIGIRRISSGYLIDVSDPIYLN